MLYLNAIYLHDNQIVDTAMICYEIGSRYLIISLTHPNLTDMKNHNSSTVSYISQFRANTYMYFYHFNIKNCNIHEIKNPLSDLDHSVPTLYHYFLIQNSSCP